MLLSTKYQWLGSTTLVLALAGPSYLAFAQPADNVVTSHSDASVANYGRAGGQVSALQPTQPPKVLTDAYEQTRAYVGHAYEMSKAFLVESAQGQASKEQAARIGVEADTRKLVASGAAIGAYGRAGTQSSLSTDQPWQPPQALNEAYAKTSAYVKHAYEKTAEFLTQSVQRPTAEQPTPFSGS